MQINVKQLEAGGPGRDNELDFACDLDLSRLRFWGDAPYPAPVSVKGTVFRRADIFTVDYTVKAVRRDRCARCLKPVEAAEEFAFSHILLEDGREEEEFDGYLPIPQGKLDVDGMVAADLALEQNGVALCSPDCMGLCPKCGADRNEKSCGCILREPDPRFAALRSFIEQNNQE